MDIIPIADICLKRDLPFVIFRLPGSRELNVLISERGVCKVDGNDIFKAGKEGFVLHPFKSGENELPCIFLSSDICFSSQDNFSYKDVISRIEELKTENNLHIDVFDCPDIGKEDYIRNIEELKDSIADGKLLKAVVSKTKTINGISKDKLLKLFVDMSDSYNDAFTYLVNIPGNCAWLGASPELLLQKDGNSMSTVALAGTQSYNGENISQAKWGDKEKDEQRIVCDYISTIADSVGMDYQCSEAYTVRAGNLLHIKNDFTMRGDTDDFVHLLKELHPTPAVCGMPKDEALRAISKAERHQREYYSGYAGIVRNSLDVRLYVNLRCARYYNDSLCIYVGGGITAGSVPEDEWNETEAKAQTIISLL